MCALAGSGCGPAGEPPAPWPPGDSSYAFDRPDADFELPTTLEEISGLTYFDAGRLAAVQDEKGSYFILDAATGAVLGRQEFENDADYEGIERVGDSLYVLRSDGDLFEVWGWEGERLHRRRRPTGLTKGCDAEGLGYQASTHRLLIACKARPGQVPRGHKAVFAFDLATGRLLPEPAFLIPDARFNATIRDEKAIDESLRRLLAPILDLSGFTPSGLAVHPRTGQVYVLSSVRKAVLVLDAGGEVAGVWALPEALVPQPEGITFLPNGDLFIATEGPGSIRGRLLRFNYRE